MGCSLVIQGVVMRAVPAEPSLLPVSVTGALQTPSLAEVTSSLSQLVLPLATVGDLSSTPAPAPRPTPPTSGTHTARSDICPRELKRRKAGVRRRRPPGKIPTVATPAAQMWRRDW